MQKLVLKSPIQRFKQGKRFGYELPYIPIGGVQAMRQKYLGKSNMDVAKEETHNYLEGLRNKYVRPFNKKNNPSTKTITPVNNYYLKGFENRKAELTQQGKTVRDIQKMLGFTGKDLDGKWGKNTENAYKQYLLNKEKPVVAPTIQQISQTPLDNTIHKGFTQVMNTPPIIANLPKQRNFNFNKSQIRNLISQKGFDPYKYTGAQRKALRLYLNGESDDTSLLDGTDLARFTLPFKKQGGQLISRNPVERFKNKIK